MVPSQRPERNHKPTAGTCVPATRQFAESPVGESAVASGRSDVGGSHLLPPDRRKARGLGSSGASGLDRMRRRGGDLRDNVGSNHDVGGALQGASFSLKRRPRREVRDYRAASRSRSIGLPQPVPRGAQIVCRPCRQLLQQRARRQTHRLAVSGARRRRTCAASAALPRTLRQARRQGARRPTPEQPAAAYAARSTPHAHGR